MPPSNALKQLWQASSASLNPRSAAPRSFRPAQRFLATHSQHQPNLDASSSKESAEEMLKRLEAEMRGKAQPAGTGGGTRLGSDGRGNVGPFPMGNGGRDKTWKKWRDLNIAGKRESTAAVSLELTRQVGRTTRQTGNLTVVILGGGLFVVLTIALTTELFAKNSPSVLYSQAVDMIRESDAVSISKGIWPLIISSTHIYFHLLHSPTRHLHLRRPVGLHH
jgi:import inner membrane translocase subunit TIM21